MDDRREEEMLIAGGVPMPHWPPQTRGRQQYDAPVARVAAADAAEYEGKRVVQLLEYQLAAAAVPPARRR
jgi:hypothetical protein